MDTLTRDADRLYRLLPVFYRQLEEPLPLPPPPILATRQPLRQLLQLVTAQADLIEADIWRLWDNFFIETSDTWAIPYIGALVGNALLHDGGRGVGPDLARQLFRDLVGRNLRPPIAIRTRADVAKTIYYRRRKGTLPMLEELARDVTGWPAHPVPMFEQLEWTQQLEHVRLTSAECPDLRRVDVGDHVSGPFDFASHSVDVRPISQYDGWYNLRNIAFFFWRLQNYELAGVRARQFAPGSRCFTFSPLGNPAPLFSSRRREGGETALATELDVAAPIRRALFQNDLVTNQGATHGTIYGDFDVCDQCSVFVSKAGTAIPIAQVRCKNLDTWPANAPGALHNAEVWIDVRSGRIVFGTDFTTADDVTVSYNYGFSADLGGGPYERGKWLIDRHPPAPAIAPSLYIVGIGGDPTIGAALQHWQDDGRPSAIISITDDARYAESIAIDLPLGCSLAIEAESRARPHVLPAGGEIVVTSTIPGVGQAATFTVSGLLVEGGIRVDGDLSRLRVLHSTLVPGRSLDGVTGFAASTNPSLTVKGTSGAQRINAQLRVEIAFSIVGPLRVTEHADGIWLLDSILDGVRTSATSARVAAIDATETTTAAQHWAPPAAIERCTVFGPAFVAKLELGSNSIFADAITAEQQVSGCARFSWFAPKSKTPRRYRCQPGSDDELSLVPTFTDLRYGQPGYAQLHLATPVEIRTGAEDGAEMGAFSHLKQPQRETNLRIRLDEYLPLGLTPGVVYVT